MFYTRTEEGTYAPLGEPVNFDFDYESTEPLGYPDVTLSGGGLTMTIDLDRKSKRIFAYIFQMPKYKATEWIFPRKKKRGTKRRRRKEMERKDREEAEGV